jgi:hypothetical protein
MRPGAKGELGISRLAFYTFSERCMQNIMNYCFARALELKLARRRSAHREMFLKAPRGIKLGKAKCCRMRGFILNKARAWKAGFKIARPH